MRELINYVPLVPEAQLDCIANKGGRTNNSGPEVVRVTLTSYVLSKRFGGDIWMAARVLNLHKLLLYSRTFFLTYVEFLNNPLSKKFKIQPK